MRLTPVSPMLRQYWATAPATQVSYVDATSSIQTQLDTKITESAVALLIASEADNLQAQLDAIDTRLTNAGY